MFCIQLSTAAVNVALLAFAADRRAAATLGTRRTQHDDVDRYLLSAGRPAANPPHANKQTDML